MHCFFPIALGLSILQMSSKKPASELVIGARPILTERHLAVRLGVPLQELHSLSYSSKNHYRILRRQKKSGKLRIIHSPHGRLRLVQDRIRKALFASIRLPAGMLGGVRGRSTRDNARLHTGQECTLSLDLRDCFSYTTNARVYRALIKYMGYAPDVARLVTKLTTTDGHVPQGAPTSSALVNLALLDMYWDLELLALQSNLNFSIWVDDITFSGRFARKVVDDAVRIIGRHRYKVHPAKVKVASRSVCQEVTGQVVNQRPGISKRNRDAVEAAIYELAASESCSIRDVQSVIGRIAYIDYACPGQAKYLRKLAKDLL
jgi:RNA-directed DNA polymerase